MTRRAALYARVSSDDLRDGKEGRNLESQLEMCRDYARENGMVVVAELPEDERGASGAEIDLPGINRALEMARDGEFDVLVVREIDRLARGLAKQIILEKEFTRHAVKIAYVIGEYDETPEGQLQKNVRAVVAEYEREQIARRTRRGKANAARQGRVIMGGRPPFGYRVQYGENGARTLVAHGEEAAVVRNIYDWYVNGLPDFERASMRAIADHLTGKGVLTAGDKMGHVSVGKLRGEGVWSPQSVRRILRSSTYVGCWVYTGNNETITVDVEPIITPMLWNRAQAKRRERFRDSPRRTKHEYLLRSRVFCRCGYRMNGTASDGRGRYRCAASKRGAMARDCPHGVVGYLSDDVDRQTWAAVRAAFENVPDMRATFSRYRDLQQESATPLRAELASVRAEREPLVAQIERLVDLYAAGQFGRDVVQARMERLERLLESSRRREADLLAQIAQAEARVMTLDFDAFVELSADLLAAANFKQRRWAVEQLDVKVLLWQSGRMQYGEVSFMDVPISTFEMRLVRRPWSGFKETCDACDGHARCYSTKRRKDGSVRRHFRCQECGRAWPREYPPPA